MCAYAEVMAAYELDGACILSHSFGTAITSWLVQYRPELVRGVVLLDPAVLCIHLRKLLFNFIYARQALDSVPGLLRSELFINNCLRRNFYWYSAALFGEDLLACCPSVVVLSECDEGVPSNESYAMLEQLTGGMQAGERGAGGSARPQAPGGHAAMTVVMLEGQGHGDFLSCAASQGIIIDHARRLYRQLASPSDASSSGAQFVRWQRGSTVTPSAPPAQSTSVSTEQPRAQRPVAGDAVALSKAGGGAAAASAKATRSVSAFSAISACTRWWRSLRESATRRAGSGA